MTNKPYKTTKRLDSSTELTVKDKVQVFFTKSKLLVFIWVVVVFLSSIMTIFQGSTLLLNLFNSSIGEKGLLYKKLSLLAPNVNISYFTEKLGKPSITHTKEKSKEFIFINKYFYVQAITDSDDMVNFFSVTSRARDFQPKFKMPGYSSDAKDGYVTLNKTTFYDINKEIKKFGDSKDQDVGEWISPNCYIYMGSHKFRYFEGEYLANPGNYQSIYIGVNDAGYYDATNPESSSLWQEAFDNGDKNCLEISDKFRKSMTVNTYAEAGEFVYGVLNGNKETLPIIDSDEVRIIN